jgi:hypothetical protein
MKETIVKFRIAQEGKERLRAIAKSRGMKMSEVMTRLLYDSPLPDLNERKERFIAIHNLSKEINYIGKNINQITIAIRQMNADKKLEDGELEMLLHHLELFNHTKNEMSGLLKEAIGFDR